MEKLDYNEKFCGKCGKTEMILSRQQILALPMEERRKILAKQSEHFVKDHPDYFKGLLK